MFAEIAQQRRPDEESQITGRCYHTDAGWCIGAGIAGGRNGQREAQRGTQSPKYNRHSCDPGAIDKNNQPNTQRPH